MAGIVVDAVDVVYVDDAGGAEAAEELGEEVHGEAAPGETAVEAVGEGYGGVEVGAGAREGRIVSTGLVGRCDRDETQNL